MFRKNVLIETHELTKLLTAKPRNLVILNSTNGGAQSLEKHNSSRIPTSINFNYPDCPAEGDYPHMVPSTEAFNRFASQLEFTKKEKFVIYSTDNKIFTSKAWHTFKTMGCEHVQILNGDWQKWTAEGAPTESGESRKVPYFY
jgi:3-mercaptopyruvate sulfurtransferase SseA